MWSASSGAGETADLTLNLDQLTLVTMHASASEEADACDMMNGGESCTHTHTYTHTHTHTHKHTAHATGQAESQSSRA